MVDITVDNGDLHDYAVRSSETATNKLIQHVRLDVGSGSTESQVSTSNGIPVTSKIHLTGASPTQATIGTSSGVAVSANSSRKGLVLTNTSANVISLAFGTAAVLYRGITLTEYGTFVMDEFTFTTEEVRAIASVASSNLAIQEFS